MGKDTTKALNSTSSSASRLYSPWLLSENARKSSEMGSLSHFSKNDDVEVHMDQEMTLKILQIEKQELERIEKVREEGADEDISILRPAQHLNLYPCEDTTVNVSESDLQLEPLLAIPEYQHTPLLTLKDKFAADKQTDCNNLLSATDPKVKRVYKKIGLQLSRDPLLKSPTKACKIIPSLPNWDEILLLTNPAKWSPQAIYDMTLIFTKTVRMRQTAQFYQFVLLPLTRQNLTAKGTLDQPIFFALQKAIASNANIFIKGFIVPLFESNSCTVQEAMVLSSVISQAKMNQSSPPTGLYLLSAYTPTLPLCILILSFLKKPQFMPQRVVDYMANKFFCQPVLQAYPIIWYQALYIFVDRYGRDLCHKRSIAKLMERVPPSELTGKIEAITKNWSTWGTDEDEETDEEAEESDDAQESSDESMAID